MDNNDPIIPDGSAAKVVHAVHNNKNLPYRIVSSDGVLFYASKKALIQSDVLWHMAETATASEICLTDDDLENARVISTVLDILVGDFEILSPVDVCDALLFADKYSIDLVIRACCNNLTRYLRGPKRTVPKLHVFRYFYAAAIVDCEKLAAAAVQGIVSHKDSWALPDRVLRGINLGNIPTAYTWALTQMCSDRQTDANDWEEEFRRRLERMKDIMKSAQKP